MKAKELDLIPLLTERLRTTLNYPPVILE